MTEKIQLGWLDGMAFEAEVNGHKIVVDAVESVGGRNLGPRPKPLLLASLAGCTAMDVISILEKMRVKVDAFHVEVVAEQTEEHPKAYSQIKILYKFKGKDLPMDKLQKAVDLSQERYCGVSAMLRKASELSFEIIVEE
ncbi:MAG: putative redox protein [Bacteroidales bacterium]|jgi:putative redox protein|nr:putative redox protein [Bacteroidales bacterium]MDN5330603.1 putative redox protein [Bacteroidales bacterium]